MTSWITNEEDSK